MCGVMTLSSLIEQADQLPEAWQALLGDELRKAYYAQLRRFVADERQQQTIYPPQERVFTAFRLCPPQAVRVVILGQDPYHGEGQAHGLSFSVQAGVATPPSLRNMFKELVADIGCPMPVTGDLTPWARQGVLMLNAVLTVRAGLANSHKDRGWEQFTDAVISVVSERLEPSVFVLWGNYAKKKSRLIDQTRHRLIQGAHPSPLSARLFMGSRPFSAINAALAELGRPPIDWRIP